MLLGAAAAIGGLYLLCWQSGLSWNIGDLYTLACSFLFAAHIMTVDAAAPKTDGLMLSCLQFGVCAVLSAVAAAVSEPPVDWSMVSAAWIPLLYAGVLSGGVAYTLQILGQRRTTPLAASLLMSTESVFAAVAGAVLLGQRLSLRETAGCCLMFAAVWLAQLPYPLRIRSRS